MLLLHGHIALRWSAVPEAGGELETCGPSGTQALLEQHTFTPLRKVMTSGRRRS